MNFHVITLFPEMIENAVSESIIGRARKSGAISVDTVNIRDFSTNTRNRVDDYPYGGGAGMVMEAEPVYRAVCCARERAGSEARTVYLTPQGTKLDQTKVEELAKEKDLILLCGHYEGIDERVLEETVTDYISIGDYVLTGGELAALVLIDAVSRFVPGVLNNEESSQFESFQDNLLEYPHYTRPEVWHGKCVPPVLLTGDHGKIEQWRYEQSAARTAARRPDLLAVSYHIVTAWTGAEETGDLAFRITQAVSRYGEILNYNRKKLQRQLRVLEENDFLLAVAAPDAPAENASEDCGGKAGAESEKAVPGLPERFYKLRGTATPAVVLYDRGIAEEERLRLVRRLTENGFRVFRQLCIEDDPDWISGMSLAVRGDMVPAARS